METELEKRIQRLEDIEEIKQLKSSYVYRLDEKDWDRFLDCFTDDCLISYGSFGEYRNKEALGHYFREEYPRIMGFTLHMTQDPIIEVDGSNAKGMWHMHASCTFVEGDKAAWVAVKYHDTFRKEDGAWKIASIIIEYIYFTPYEEGWAKTRLMA